MQAEKATAEHHLPTHEIFLLLLRAVQKCLPYITKPTLVCDPSESNYTFCTLYIRHSLNILELAGRWSLTGTIPLTDATTEFSLLSLVMN